MILDEFWPNLGSQDGCKIDPNRYKILFEKRVQKKLASGTKKSENETLQVVATRPVQVTGEGVGGGINPSSGGGWRGLWKVCAAKPPSPRRLVGLAR